MSTPQDACFREASVTSSYRRPSLPALTGVRFVAAFAVVAHHFANSTNEFVQAGIEHGLIGVSLFFILSGFILSYTYYLSSGAFKGSDVLFWTARFARIYPMYIVGMIAMAPLIFAWSNSKEAWNSGLAGITLTQAWLPLSTRAWNPPGWSLSAEAMFYLLFPFMVRAISTRRSGCLFVAILLCWAASSVASCLFIYYGTVDRDFWMFNPLARLPEFAIGVIAGVLWVQRRVPAVFLFPYATELASFIVIVILFTPMHEAHLMNGALAPLLTIIILGLATGRGPIARLLGTKLFGTLGAASFSLYIIHWPLWYLSKSVANRLDIDVNSSVAFWGITTGVLIPASYVCFRFIEEPANKMLRSYFSRRLESAPSATPPQAALVDRLTSVGDHKPGSM